MPGQPLLGTSDVFSPTSVRHKNFCANSQASLGSTQLASCLMVDTIPGQPLLSTLDKFLPNFG